MMFRDKKYEKLKTKKLQIPETNRINEIIRNKSHKPLESKTKSEYNSNKILKNS
jgi:hypothetical protein